MRIISLVSLLFVASVMSADVMYEMTSTTSGMMGMKAETQMRVFVKGDRSLTEMTAENPMTGPMSDTKIIRLDKGVIWSIDHENEKYSEHSLETMSGATEEYEETEMEMPELKVFRTGEKKQILKKDCEQVIVSMESAGEEGKMTFKQTMWVTKEIPGYKEIQEFQKQMAESGLGSSSAMMGPNKKNYEEFQKKISEIDGFPLEIDMDITMGGEGMSFTMTTHSEVTKIETKPINDRVFEIPAGYSLQE
ncbi:MAG: DUF4412 domain-containing protein [candidate division WOR-3 bacterium]|nr:MAG: DUF4412 domain-containing protein [candidate division WOR-3 bacterium]